MTPIKTALLAYGSSGRIFHAPFIQMHDGFQLMGAWERTKKTIQQFYPETKSYPTIESVLNDAEVELVVINTPTFTHYDYAKRALLAGKHIIVEKAFTTSLTEALDLKEIAKKQEKKIAVFQNRRWDSDFKTCKKILQENKIGDIVEAEIHFDRYNPNISPKKHKEEPGPGAGLLKDLGPHLIDQALSLFGLPESLYADLRKTRPNSQVDDWFDIVFIYPTKRVRLKAGYLVKEMLPSYIFHGQKGSFIKSRADVQEMNLGKNIKPTISDWGKEPDNEKGILHYQNNQEFIREEIISEKGNYLDFYNGVFNALRNNSPMPVTVDDGIHIIKCIEKCIESSKLGKKIIF